MLLTKPPFYPVDKGVDERFLFCFQDSVCLGMHYDCYGDGEEIEAEFAVFVVETWDVHDPENKMLRLLVVDDLNALWMIDKDDLYTELLVHSNSYHDDCLPEGIPSYLMEKVLKMV